MPLYFPSEENKLHERKQTSLGNVPQFHKASGWTHEIKDLNSINNTASTTSRRVLITFPALTLKTMTTNEHSIIR